MAINYENQPLKWENEGAMPPLDVQASGFIAGYKPPAAYFNFHWNNTYKCLKELQDALSNENTQRQQAISKITKTNLGLDKVDNTADDEKSVKYAKSSGKVENSLSVKLNDGTIEGMDLWNFDGSKPISINITPDGIGAAKNNLSNVDPIFMESKLKGYGSDFNKIGQAASPDGISYDATILGVKSLYDGLEVIVTPTVTSTSTTITLNVNNLGAKSVRLPYNFNTSAIGLPELPTFFGGNKPIKLRYFENAEVMVSGEKIQGVWVAVEKPLVSASYVSGILAPEHGGSGIDADSTADLTNQLNKSLITTANATDGINYTSTVEGITELHNGMEITIIPSMNNGTTAPTLNINNLGAVRIRRILGSNTFTTNAPEINHIRAGVPCKLMYHATYTTGGTWIILNTPKISVSDLYGSFHSTTTKTLSSSKWVNNEYSFEDDYPSDEYDIDLCLNGDNLTEEQKNAYSDAEIVGCSSNKIKALGTVPTINIPIIIKAVKK